MLINMDLFLFLLSVSVCAIKTSAFTGGEQIIWSNWARGQGQLQSGFMFSSGSLEDCAMIRLTDGYTWHSYPCNNFIYRYTSICEYAMTHDSLNVTSTATTTNIKNLLTTKDVKNATGVEVWEHSIGDNVILKCPFRQQNRSHFIWHGPPNLQTLYADDAFTNPRICSISIVGDKDEFNLQINYVTRFDNGRYRCTMFENGVSGTHEVELRVKA